MFRFYICTSVCDLLLLTRLILLCKTRFLLKKSLLETYKDFVIYNFERKFQVTFAHISGAYFLDIGGWAKWLTRMSCAFINVQVSLVVLSAILHQVCFSMFTEDGSSGVVRQVYIYILMCKQIGYKLSGCPAVWRISG